MLDSDRQLTHNELVEIARRWLKARCNVVITEMAGGHEEADAIGWKSGVPILIECKASKVDFLGDRYKSFRRDPVTGLGYQRYYLTPPGLLNPDELPEKWGLLEPQGKRVRVRKKPEHFLKYNRGREIEMLLSALRRVGSNCPQGISIRVYPYETKNRATLTLSQGEDC